MPTLVNRSRSTIVGSRIFAPGEPFELDCVPSGDFEVIGADPKETGEALPEESDRNERADEVQSTNVVLASGSVYPVLPEIDARGSRRRRGHVR